MSNNKIQKGLRNSIFSNRKSYHTGKKNLIKNVKVNLGWGRLFFAQTSSSQEKLAEALLDEKPGARNLAFYVQEPQVLLKLGEGQLFLDPSLSYRLDLFNYKPIDKKPNIQIRFLDGKDIAAVNDLYKKVRALPIGLTKAIKNQHSRAVTYFVAEKNGEIVGVITGIDHVELFNSPEGGSSLWGLAVAPEVQARGVGRALIDAVANHFKTRGRSYLDLSVIHDNQKAIQLYEKIGFRRIARFCVKCKNKINKKLYS